MRILKLFKKHILALFTAIVLIVISCNADLALPTYMSDIVDVGVQQGGIASPVPDTIRAESLDDLELFMSAKDAKAVEAVFSKADKNGIRTYKGTEDERADGSKLAEAKSGQPGSGREGMALGQYVAGMGFSNVGLGIDHAMAHTLSAHYDTPHGVACAMLLPIAMEFNKPVCAERLAKVAVAMGVDTTGMSTDEAADAAIAAVKQLSADVNIPHVCEAMKADEIEVLAKDAMADACFPGNPREATLDDVIELFKKICPAA